MSRAMVLCAVKGSQHVYIKPGVVPQERICQGDCGRVILLSATSAVIPNADYFCNDCGRALVAANALLGREMVFGIAPGALSDDDKNDRRRRNELEAHGFRDITEQQMRDLHG